VSSNFGPFHPASPAKPLLHTGPLPQTRIFLRGRQRSQETPSLTRYFCHTAYFQAFLMPSWRNN